MALITRVSRLFQADLHAVLDRIEEPDILLKQAVREMEDELLRDEQRLKLLQHEQSQMQVRESELEQSLVEIGQELDICFESGKEKLAKAMVRRKLEAQGLKRVLSRKCTDLGETISRLETQQKEYQMRLDNMRQKAELLTEEQDRNDSAGGWPSATVSIQDEDVEVAFLREKKNRRAS
ncbi:MAG: PspA/IM30 family protein [Arenicellales bacterium]